MKTNRDYFSWSQYHLWLTSKREFWKRYNIGEESKSNRFFDKGKELAKFQEVGITPPVVTDPMLELVAGQIPKTDLVEAEINTKLRSGAVLKGFCDGLQKDFKMFTEIKTGKEPWDDVRVQNWEQLDFYALVIFLETGILPTAKLVWVETMETDDGLRYTGNVEVFERTFEIELLGAFANRIQKAIEEIADYTYKEYEPSKAVVSRYYELLKQKEQIEQELDLIKMDMFAKMSEFGSTFARGLEGNFIISKRKTWTYSVKLEAKTQEIKQLQKEEQKDGTAVYKVIESIQFKQNKNV